jgi:hypothetical protein
MRRGVESSKMADHHRSAAAGIEAALDSSIFSDDENAVEALTARIAEREAERERMKLVNKLYRGKKAAELDAILGEGAYLKLREKLEAPDVMSWCRVPYPAYELSNLGGRITADRKRLEAIKVTQARAERAEASSSGVVLEDGGSGYCRVTFADKPAREILTALKAAGFWWSRGSWAGKRDALPASVLALLEPPADPEPEPPSPEPTPEPSSDPGCDRCGLESHGDCPEPSSHPQEEADAIVREMLEHEEAPKPSSSEPRACFLCAREGLFDATLDGATVRHCGGHSAASLALALLAAKRSQQPVSWLISAKAPGVGHGACKDDGCRFYLTAEHLATDIQARAVSFLERETAQAAADAARKEPAWRGYDWQPLEVSRRASHKWSSYPHDEDGNHGPDGPCELTLAVFLKVSAELAARGPWYVVDDNGEAGAWDKETGEPVPFTLRADAEALARRHDPGIYHATTEKPPRSKLATGRGD